MDKLFTVTVIDVNEQPSSVSVQSDGGQLNFTTDFPQVNEDARPGTAVGTVEVLDVDTYNGEGMVIALDDSDGGRFRMATGAGVTCGSTTLPVKFLEALITLFPNFITCARATSLFVVPRFMLPSP